MFERKFDLPSQRRRFVENLVDEKLPSIGYLHLITLINNYYFNTIFTTNFDDLINEAFYQFSNTRPLICAHDSAVGSVSVISKRPKIIKLHGDYLYDDIKNTIKETESLEQNIKEKFIEFTKDNGLIVVGYSGQDRSILDVLNYLLQQEEYLKNGLYWCFRAEDEISHEVRKILWRDKVYCVEIDGFDELFTEFCHHVQIKPNLIDSSSDSKREKCIKKFIEDYEKSSKNNLLIKEFIEEVSTARNNQDISDLIRQLNENKNTNISQENLKSFLEVERLINKFNYDEALQKINIEYKNTSDDDLKESYTSMKIRIYKHMKKNNLAIEIIEKLILEDPFNPKFYQWKLSFIEDLVNKIDFLLEANTKIINNCYFKNYITDLFIYNQENEEYLLKINFEDCEKIINESLALDSSLDNEAYELKYKLLNTKISKEVSKERNIKIKAEKEESVSNEINRLISQITLINKLHVASINLRKIYVLDKKDINLINDFIKDLTEIKKIVYNDKAKQVISIISSIYLELRTKDTDGYKNKENLDFSNIDSFFENYDDDHLKKDNVNFLLNRFQYIHSRNINLEEIIDYLDEILKVKNVVEYIRTIASTFTTFNINAVNYKLEKFIEDNKNKLKIEDYYFCLSEIESSNLKYDNALDFLDKSYKSLDKELDGDEIIAYTYALLLSEKYDDIEIFLKEKKALVKNLSKIDRAIIDINSIVAKKLKEGFLSETDKTTLSNYLAKYSNNKRVLICVNSLLEKNNEAIFHMKEQISLDYKTYYAFIEWPGINQKIKNDIKQYYSDITNNIRRKIA